MKALLRCFFCSELAKSDAYYKCGLTYNKKTPCFSVIKKVDNPFSLWSRVFIQKSLTFIKLKVQFKGSFDIWKCVYKHQT